VEVGPYTNDRGGFKEGVQRFYANRRLHVFNTAIYHLFEEGRIEEAEALFAENNPVIGLSNQTSGHLHSFF